MAKESVGGEPRYCTGCGAEFKQATKYCPECGTEVGGSKGAAAPSRQASTTAEEEEYRKKAEPSGRLASAAIGSIPAFFFGWVPFLGPMAGGFVAGRLRGSDEREGAISGALATVFASIVFLLFGLLGVAANLAEGNTDTVVDGGIFWAVALAYFCAFGAVGGLIGAETSSRASPHK